MRLHSRQDDPEQQRGLGSGNIPNPGQHISSSISATRPSCAPPVDRLGPHLTEPQGILPVESGDLLEWLMSDLNGAPVVPLPLIDIPPGSSSANDVLNLNYHLGDLDTESSLTNASAPGNMALDQIYRMIDDLSRRLNSDVHRSGFTSAFLDSCLQEFFTRISPNFPVIHKQTFSPQKSIPPLLLNMVALGSLFVCEKDAIEKGEMLWRLGHTAVATSWQTLIELRGPWDACDGIQLVLTALLGQTYALVSSNANIRTTASVFHGLGFYWARTSGMYAVHDGLMEGLPSVDMSEQVKNTRWKTWAAGEVQRRAILGHYILDGLISQASGSPASARHLINSLGTACSDAAFTAETADQWIYEMTRVDTEQLQIPVSEAFTRIFASRYPAEPLQLSRLSVFVIVEGLQSLISDLHETRGPVFGAVSSTQIIQAMLNIHQGNIESTATISPSDPHDNIPALIRWHSVFIELTAPSISIYRWLCNRYQLPQVLGGIHARSRLEDLDLHQWAMKPDAFRAVLHAISITHLLENLPLSLVYTMHIPTAVFTSAMVIASMCIFHQTVIKIPKTCNWSEIWQDTADISVNQENTMDVNLVEKMNSLQVVLKTVASQWGVSAQMGEIIMRLTAIAQGAQHSV